MRSFLRKKSITRALVLGAIASVFALPVSPAHAAAAAFGEATTDDGRWHTTGSCVGQSVSTNGRRMDVVVEGQAVAQGPAIGTIIACHAYVDGVHVGVVGGTGFGSVGAAAGVITDLPIGPYEFCVEIHSTYLTGVAHTYC